MAQTAPRNTPETARPVAEVSAMLGDWIHRLGSVWVAGELTEWNLRKGTRFGRLKDAHAEVSLPITVWASTLARIGGTFQTGDRVVVLATPKWYGRNGSLTLEVSALRQVGLGALMEGLELLRQKLTAEGLFAPERKRRLPFLPRVVGLVTGAGSDAEQDVRRNAALRWPGVVIRAAYATVQGDRAVPELIQAIAELDTDPTVDVIVVARGGGDFETLLPFSDERLLRAVAATTTPVVSAIGHEPDRPLLDDVADFRASTPTDAGKSVVPDVYAEREHIAQYRHRLDTCLRTRLTHERDRLMDLRQRPSLASGQWLVTRYLDDIGRLTQRSTDLADRTVERARATITELATHLRALSPQATLDRGYAVVTVDRGSAAPGTEAHSIVVRDPAEAPDGTALRIQVAAGTLEARSHGPVDGPRPVTTDS